MNNPTFDAAFAELLRAFNQHETLRASRADFTSLSRSSHELFKARLAMHHANR